MTNLENRLDSIFSIFVRLYSADHAGYVSCYTCGKRMHWRDAQNGHWQRRGSHATRWEADNCAPQCSDCNTNHNGRYDAFEENLRDDIGHARVEELIKMAQSSRKFTDEELKGKLVYFTKCVENMGYTQ